MKKHGFYCRMYGKDCFYEAEQQRKTKKLAEDFILSVQFKLGKNRVANDADIAFIQNNMRRATLEIKTIESGNFAGMGYYEISGENFSYGCDACENPTDKFIFI